MFKFIYLFEMKNTLYKKSFKISILVFCAIIFLITFIPRLATNNIFDSASKKIGEMASKDHESDSDLMYAIYIEDSSINAELLTENASTDLSKSVLVNSKEDLIEHVKNKIVKKGFYIKDLNNIEFITNTLSMHGYNEEGKIKNAILKYKESKFLNDNKLSIDNFMKATDISDLNIEIKALTKNEMAAYPIAYASLFLMYMMIITHAQYTSISVAREKNDRTMELLITSANTNLLILGKVFASCSTAIIKMVLSITAGALGITINAKYYPLFLLDLIKNNLNSLTLSIFLAFFIVGYIMYNVLFAAVGALVERMEDINSVAQPIILIVVLIFFAGMISINLPNPALNNILAVIPLSSPMVILSAVVMRGMSLYLVAISFILLLTTTILLCYLAAKIYRLGSLSYGNKIGFFKALKMIFSKN